MQALSRKLSRGSRLLHRPATSNGGLEDPKARFFSCFAHCSSAATAPTTTTRPLVLNEAIESPTVNEAQSKGKDDSLSQKEPSRPKIRTRAGAKPSRRARAKRARSEPSKSRFTADNRHYDLKERQTTGNVVWRPVYSSSPYVTKDELKELTALLNPQLEDMQKQTYLAARKNRRRVVNREYLLEKGSLAYDWRLPLAQLKQYTQKSGQESGAGWGTADGEGDSLLQTVREDAIAYKSVHVDKIPVPQEWSRKTVAQYVFDLTESHVPTAHSTLLYGEGSGHREAVMNRLMVLFEDESVRPHLSHTVFHTAMKWLHQASYVDRARRLFFTMADFQMPPTRETFHIVFADIARKKNLHAFSSLLKIMISRMINPNARTWYLFFRCVDSKLVKLLILDNMKTLGLLRDVHILRATTTELVPSDAMEHLANGGKLEDVIREYDGRYGPRWFCTSAVNAICHASALAGRFHTSAEVLGLMQARKRRPDRATLEILLKGYRTAGRGYREGGIYGAVETLRLFEERYGIQPDARCFDILMKTGWDLNRANFCRAVWRVACLRAEVTGGMYLRAIKGLAFRLAVAPAEGRAAMAEGEPAAQMGRFVHFYAYPAKIIAGIESDEGAEAAEALRSLVRESEKSATPADELSKEETTRLARVVRDADLRSSVRLEFRGSLGNLLTAALETDKAWIGRDEYRAGNVGWMLANAVEVPTAERARADVIGSESRYGFGA